MTSEEATHERSMLKDAIHVHTTIPKSGEFKAVLFMSHGYLEHHGRYERFCKEMLADNFAIVQYDLRGHGESKGSRAHAVQFDHYLEDFGGVLEIAAKLAEKSTSKKFTVFSHSISGLITCLYFIKNKETPKGLAGIVLSAPYLWILEPPNKREQLLMAIFGKILPKTKVPLKKHVKEGFCRDEETNRTRIEDKMCMDALTIGWFLQTRAAQKHVREHSEELFPVPAMVFVAGKDVVVDPEVALEVVRKMKNTTVHFMETFHHELFQEPEADRKKVMAEMKTFLETCCQ